MESGKVPQQWKRSDVILIYKSGNKEEPLNHRPVSLTSIVCKLCERVIKKQWIECLEKENIQTGWIQRRMVMFNEFAKILFKSILYNSGKGRVGGLHILGFKYSF